MMKRLPGGVGSLVWFCLLFILAGYYLVNFYAQQRMIATAGSQAQPRQFEIPRLPVYSKTSTPLSSWQLWNLNPEIKGVELQPVASGPKARYGVKSFGNVQGLYSLKNQKMRWEFYGITQQGGQTLAVFFNPSLADQGWISIGQSQELSPGLRLEEITENRVMIMDTEGESSETWELTLFAFDATK